MSDMSAGESAQAVAGDESPPPWRSVAADPVLSRPPTPGSPGSVPPGDDLRLDIGWDRFEQLLVFVARDILGLGQVRFRRAGSAAVWQAYPRSPRGRAGGSPSGSMTPALLLPVLFARLVIAVAIGHQRVPDR